MLKLENGNAYIISIKEKNDRAKSIENLKSIIDGNVEVIEAFTPDNSHYAAMDVTDSRLDILSKFPNRHAYENHARLMRYLSCGISHYHAIVNAKNDIFHNGRKEYALILEDDASFNYVDYVNLDEIVSDLPDDWDILYLGGQFHEKLSYEMINTDYRPMAEDYDDTFFKPRNGYFQSHAYVIRIRKETLERADMLPDTFSYGDTGLMEIFQMRGTAYALKDSLFDQRGGNSHIIKGEDYAKIYNDIINSGLDVDEVIEKTDLINKPEVVVVIDSNSKISESRKYISKIFNSSPDIKHSFSNLNVFDSYLKAPEDIVKLNNLDHPNESFIARYISSRLLLNHTIYIASTHNISAEALVGKLEEIGISVSILEGCKQRSADVFITKIKTKFNAKIRNRDAF